MKDCLFENSIEQRKFFFWVTFIKDRIQNIYSNVFPLMSVFHMWIFCLSIIFDDFDYFRQLFLASCFWILSEQVHVCGMVECKCPLSFFHQLHFQDRMRFEEISRNFKIVPYKRSMHSCQLKPPIFTYQCDLKCSRKEKAFCGIFVMNILQAFQLPQLSSLSPAHFGFLYTSAKPSLSSLSGDMYRSGFWMFRTCGALGDPVKALGVHTPL